MKLNNRGWGLGMFMLFLFFLSIAILFIWYSSVQVNNEFKKIKNRNSYYHELESNLINSAGLFLNDNQISECYSIGCTINYEILKNNNYVEKMLDEIDRTECDGYVKVVKDVYLPYISCSNYKTGGYR